MLLHRLLADAEFAGDLPVAEAARNRVRHLALALRESFNLQGSGLDHGVQLRSGAQLALYLPRSEEHTSELQSQSNLVCRLLLEKKKKLINTPPVRPRLHYGTSR